MQKTLKNKVETKEVGKSEYSVVSFGVELPVIFTNVTKKEADELAISLVMCY